MSVINLGSESGFDGIIQDSIRRYLPYPGDQLVTYLFTESFGDLLGSYLSGLIFGIDARDKRKCLELNTT